ncbi:hypothetical protein BH10ACI1_BH10ACI1_30050 [soil metagenome]
MSKVQFIIFILLIVTLSCVVSAQTTIFNIPSTDTLPEGRFYVEADAIVKFAKFEKGGFQTYGYRTVYGVRRNLEVGANFFYTRNGQTSPKEFQPNIKFQAYQNEKYGVALSTGAIAFVPLDKSAGTRTYAMVYTNGSKTIKSINGMRVTGGYYAVVGAERDFGTKRGLILGVEQPIRRKLSFIADWYSGNNRLGYSAAGFNYAVTKNQFLTLGYNFGNFGAGNNAFSAFYGFTF